MSQLWAVTRDSGQVNLIYTSSIEEHPSECGNAEVCEGANVWPLEREPLEAWGETVSNLDGEIVYEPEKILEHLISDVKEEAARRIESFAPLWRQINDLHDLESPGREERRVAVDAVRAWSNDLESELKAATSAEDLRQTFEKIRG